MVLSITTIITVTNFCTKTCRIYLQKNYIPAVHAIARAEATVAIYSIANFESSPTLFTDSSFSTTCCTASISKSVSNCLVLLYRSSKFYVADARLGISVAGVVNVMNKQYNPRNSKSCLRNCGGKSS